MFYCGSICECSMLKILQTFLFLSFFYVEHKGFIKRILCVKGFFLLFLSLCLAVSGDKKVLLQIFTAKNGQRTVIATVYVKDKQTVKIYILIIVKDNQRIFSCEFLFCPWKFIFAILENVLWNWQWWSQTCNLITFSSLLWKLIDWKIYGHWLPSLCEGGWCLLCGQSIDFYSSVKLWLSKWKLIWK